MHMALGMIFALLVGSDRPVQAQSQFEKDVIATKDGDVEITFIGHATLMMTYRGKVIHIDPWSRLADYTKLPKADLILITHDHGDHLDPTAIAAIRKKGTVILMTAACAAKVEGGTVMKNGDVKEVFGVSVRAVPAYNLVHKRENGTPFHPKGEGNGYVLQCADKRIYIAGDTENTPEMKALKDIDVAFLPMNLPYTMTPEMVADAARAFRPHILYPYHYGKTDVNELLKLMKGVEGVEVRVRKME